MSLDALKTELAALDGGAQRQVMAFLIALHDAKDESRQARMSRRIDDKDETHFATLEELDRRLGTTELGPE